MSDFFFNLGRKLGHVAVPALRKSKWLWQSVAGTEAETFEAEAKLGKALAHELRSRPGHAAPPDDSRLVAAIAKKLSEALGDDLRRFQAEAIQTGTPNALALPGGFIFIDVALLDLCERDPDELAFVIGHEMAHVIRRHTFDRILRRVGVDMVTTLLGRGALGLWLRQSGQDLLRSAHSQDIELEADEMGSEMSVAAGYDPRGIVRLLKRLQAMREEPDALGEYFGSHPPERIRIAHIKAHWESQG